MSNYERIDRENLCKAENLLADALMELRVDGDKELVKRIDEALDAVYCARCRTWAITEPED